MAVQEEKMAIEQTIRYFFDAIDTFDPQLVEKAFYSGDTQMLSVSEDPNSLTTGNVEKFIEKLQAYKNDATSILHTDKCEKSIIYIDVTGTAAAAKIRLQFSTFAYTDYYNLLKIAGSWRIVNKTFDTEVF